MGIRHWLRKRTAEEHEGGDAPPHTSLLHSIFGREPPEMHALGEFNRDTYPGELQDLLAKREQVAQRLLAMELHTRDARVAAIPELRTLLGTYPHPLVYETLINAYVDDARWDEARGAAFAARQRRTEVGRSPYPEIRAETDRLNEWTPEDVDALRQEHEARGAAASS